MPLWWLTKDGDRTCLALYEQHYSVKLRKDQLVCRRCDTPRCVSIPCLWLGTNQDNIDDREAKGRNVIQYGSDSHLSILKEEDVLFIKSELLKITDKRSKIPNELAKKFGVSVHAIYKIRSGHNWANLQVNTENQQ